MTIVHKDGNIHKNEDGLSRWPLPNNIDRPSYVPEEASPHIPIEVISVTDLNTAFIQEVSNSNTQDTNCSILCQVLARDSKYRALLHALAEILKKLYDEGRFHLLDGIIYLRTEYTCLQRNSRKGQRAFSKVHGGLICIHKDKWDKSHATTDFKVGDLVLLSTTNFNNIKGCKNLTYYFAGPIFIEVLHGENAVEVELSEELSNKHPTFPVRLIKPYTFGNSENFPLRTKAPQHIPPVA
ncbi:hypothetical protein O181_012375 [Austropuccinia psidii MF-1]|uniref:Uncharacterized protein n=1 Tax=Austropuccinia psidii MF-1 TaxID=1389203 RepID=A0A9Q3GMV9_9BASI|nr:hypothetical protein [Austropuccinia psidii MF-1]